MSKIFHFRSVAKKALLGLVVIAAVIGGLGLSLTPTSNVQASYSACYGKLNSTQIENLENIVRNMYTGLLGSPKPDARNVRKWVNAFCNIDNSSDRGAVDVYLRFAKEHYLHRLTLISTREFVGSMFEGILQRINHDLAWENYANQTSRLQVFADFLNTEEFAYRMRAAGINPGQYNKKCISSAPKVIGDTYDHLTEKPNYDYDYVHWEISDMYGLCHPDGGGAKANHLHSIKFSEKADILKSKDSREYVANAYRGLLHREPDAIGIRDWSAYIRTGGPTYEDQAPNRAFVAEYFVNSPEFAYRMNMYGIPL